MASERYQYFSSIKSIVLLDYEYWGAKEKELDDWLAQNTTMARMGMMITVPSDAELIIFTLRWSGR